MPWIGLIVTMVALAGGYRAVDPLYNADLPDSALRVGGYLVIYFAVTGLIVALSLAAGRRGFCHYVCWMAPFMIIGRWLRNRFRWPALALRVEKDRCVSCQICTKHCPMSLDVMGLVRQGNLEHAECVLCGTCVDTCPQDVLHYTWAGPGS